MIHAKYPKMIRNKFAALKKTIRSLLNSASNYVYYIFNKESVKRLNPIFIVGCGHSGTSVALAILGTHSKIHAIPYESQMFFGNKYSIVAQAIKWQNQCLKLGKTNWVEKTPHHIYKMGRILEIFPKAKIIVMMRDGRDVACSQKARMGDFLLGIQKWKESIIALEEFKDDSRVYLVKLEHLVKDPIVCLEKILNFLNLEYEEQILDYHKTQRYYYSQSISRPNVATDGQNHLELRNWQINQPLFKETCRWEKEMHNSEIKLFKLHAQEELERFGYTESNRW